MSEEFLWCERYRPQKVVDCILPDRLKKVFQDYVDKQSIPNLMLTGTAGVGKTTVALAMCDEIGLDYLYINASDERRLDDFRGKIKGFASTVSLIDKKKVIILDEADNIFGDTQSALRAAIEQFSNNCTFILTCNFKSKLIEPIHSRCSVIDFGLKSDEKPKMAEAFFKRITDILKKENISYDKESLISIVKKYFPDYRRTLNELQRYSTSGTIDAGVAAQIGNIRNVSDLIQNLKDKDFNAMRKWVVVNSDIDTSTIYRKIYDSLNEYLKPEYTPQAIIILAKYQYQGAFVADPEINLVACLTEIMVDCQFK